MYGCLGGLGVSLGGLDRGRGSFGSFRGSIFGGFGGSRGCSGLRSSLLRGGGAGTGRRGLLWGSGGLDRALLSFVKYYKY